MKTSLVLIMLFTLTCFADPQTKSNSAIVVQNYYYSKPGKADEVYQWRVHASEVRVKLGLRRGRVLRRVGDSTTQPDVIWECNYPDMASREAEIKTLENQPEFDEVMEHMNTLIDRFDRAIWTVN